MDLVRYKSMPFGYHGGTDIVLGRCCEQIDQSVEIRNQEAQDGGMMNNEAALILDRRRSGLVRDMKPRWGASREISRAT